MREWIRDKSEQHGFIREVFRMHYSSIDVLPIMTGSKGEKKKKMNLRNRILRSNRENEEKSGVILANFSLSLIHIIEQEERIVV